MINTQEEYERALSKYELLKDANRTDKGHEEFLSLAQDITIYEELTKEIEEDDVDYIGRTIRDKPFYGEGYDDGYLTDDEQGLTQK